MTNQPTARGALAVLTVLVLAAAIGFVALTGSSATHVTAHFERTVGVFEGSDVRIMGMRVGQVERITPRATGVAVEMTLDPEYDVPVDAKALIVAPSVISDRFIQLAPAYTGGPVLSSGAQIPLRSTRVPVELDESLATTTRLARALGPRGANRNGALSGALRTMAGVLRGSGDPTRALLRDTADVSDTLAENAPGIAANIKALSKVTGTLAQNDRQVRTFNRTLGRVAKAMAGNSRQLSRLIRTLARSLGTVATFVRENRRPLVSNVRQLKGVTKALVAEREALVEIADIAPLAFTNLTETYDPQAQAVRTRANFGEVAKVLDQAVCDALRKQAGPQAAPLCRRLNEMLDPSELP